MPSHNYQSINPNFCEIYYILINTYHDYKAYMKALFKVMQNFLLKFLVFIKFPIRWKMI